MKCEFCPEPGSGKLTLRHTVGPVLIARRVISACAQHRMAANELGTAWLARRAMVAATIARAANTVGIILAALVIGTAMAVLTTVPRPW